MGTVGVSCLKKLGRSLGQNVARAGAGMAARLRRPYHVVLVGLDASGKTTALLRLRYGRYISTTPTVAFNCEKVRSGGGSWLVWDVGGADRLRPLWRPYTRATDALVFVVDASSSCDRLEEARVELARLVRQTGVQCKSLGRPRPPLLVMANKQDLPAARAIPDLMRALGLQEVTDGGHPWAIASVCAVTGEGLDAAMATLRKLLLAHRHGARAKRTPKQKFGGVAESQASDRREATPESVHKDSATPSESNVNWRNPPVGWEKPPPRDGSS